jgi:hypothetical protein
MKKIFILWIILSILLSSCSIDWNDEKDKKIAELEKQIQNDLFKKKQECAKHKDKIENNIKTEVTSWIVKMKYLSEIFYSNNKNTCYALLEEKDNSWKEYWIIEDILTSNKFNYKKFEDWKLFYAKIKELKSE